MRAPYFASRHQWIFESCQANKGKSDEIRGRWICPARNSHASVDL